MGGKEKCKPAEVELSAPLSSALHCPQAPSAANKFSTRRVSGFMSQDGEGQTDHTLGFKNKERSRSGENEPQN